jgi:hypothetical protein
MGEVRVVPPFCMVSMTVGLKVELVDTFNSKPLMAAPLVVQENESPANEVWVRLFAGTERTGTGAAPIAVRARAATMTARYGIIFVKERIR